MPTGIWEDDEWEPPALERRKIPRMTPQEQAVIETAIEQTQHMDDMEDAGVLYDALSAIRETVRAMQAARGK